MVRLADSDAASPRAVRRTAPARGARPGARQPAARAAARRAARRARPEAARGDAARAQAHPGVGRDHIPVRHARPGGGARDERPHWPCSTRAGSSRSGRPRKCTSGRRRRSSRASSARRTCSPGSSTAIGTATPACASGAMGPCCSRRPGSPSEAGSPSQSDRRRSACRSPRSSPLRGSATHVGRSPRSSTSAPYPLRGRNRRRGERRRTRAEPRHDVDGGARRPGRAVRLTWQPRHTFAIGDGGEAITDVEGP